MEINDTLLNVLTEAMSSTVEANNCASLEYFKRLEEIGISSSGQRSELDTVECVVRGKDDKEYVLKIPKLILMPMPLLHIKEATFDIEGEYEIKENESSREEAIELLVNAIEKENGTSPEQSSNTNDLTERARNLRSQLQKLPNIRLREIALQRDISEVARRSVLESLDNIQPTITLTRRANTSSTAAVMTPAAPAGDESGGSASTGKTASSESSKTQGLKIKMSVKMEQSDMPAGLSNLIQTVTNCIEVKEPVKEN